MHEKPCLIPIFYNGSFFHSEAQMVITSTLINFIFSPYGINISPELEQINGVAMAKVLKGKEGNDQESIQLPNTFHSKHQRGRRTFLKQRHHNQNITSRKPNGYQKWKFHQDIHAKTYNDRNSIPQQKYRLGTISKTLTGGGAGGGGRGLKSILRGHTTRP